MEATWIVSANAGRARFFSQPVSGASLEEVTNMVNSAVHLRTAETESDRIGQLAASKSAHNVGASTQPSGYEPNQTPDEHQTELFARDVADFLLKAQQEGRYEKLNLVASPQFLGVLRKQLNPTVSSAVSREINKDYTQSSPDELRKQLNAQLDKS